MSSNAAPAGRSTGQGGPVGVVGPADDAAGQAAATSTSNSAASAAVVRSSGRSRKPSAKIVANNNAAAELASRKASKASKPSRAATSSRSDERRKVELRCDFNDPASINECYPPRSSKGTFNVPIGLLTQAATRSAKAKVVRAWRNLSQRQQIEKLEQMREASSAAKDRSQRVAAADKRVAARGEKAPRKAREIETLAQMRKVPAERLSSDMSAEDEKRWQRVLRSEEQALQRQLKKNATAREQRATVVRCHPLVHTLHSCTISRLLLLRSVRHPGPPPRQ